MDAMNWPKSTIPRPIAAAVSVGAIRNKEKKAYAEVYLQHRLASSGRLPAYIGISYMAAQAVRMRIDEILADLAD